MSIDLDAIEVRHKSENWQCCKDVAALVAEVRALRDVADAARDLIDCDPDTAKLDYLIELEDAVNAWRAGGGA